MSDKVAMRVYCIQRGVVRIDEVVCQLRPVDSEIDVVNGGRRAKIEIDTEPAAVDLGNTCVIATGEVEVVEPAALKTESIEGVVVVMDQELGRRERVRESWRGGDPPDKLGVRWG